MWLRLQLWLWAHLPPGRLRNLLALAILGNQFKKEQ